MRKWRSQSMRGKRRTKSQSSSSSLSSKAAVSEPTSMRQLSVIAVSPFYVAIRCKSVRLYPINGAWWTGHAYAYAYMRMRRPTVVCGVWIFVGLRKYSSMVVHVYIESGAVVQTNKYTTLTSNTCFLYTSLHAIHAHMAQLAVAKNNVHAT